MDGKVMAELVDNEWRVNPHNYFKLNFDEPGLEIIDDYNIPWLQIDYLTPSSVKISGVFRGGENLIPKMFPNFTNMAPPTGITRLGPGGTAIIGNGRLILHGGIAVETEAQKQAFASEVREIIEPWFDYMPSKGLGVRLPPEPKVATDPFFVEIPSTAISGILGGQPFSSDRVRLFGRTMFVSQDDNFPFPPATGVAISLPLNWGEPITDRTFAVTNQSQSDRRMSVSLSWKAGTAWKSGSLSQNYVMLVEFGSPNGNRVPGKLYLESSRRKQTKLAGSFMAEVK
jgi:hypothetical protein